MLRLIVFASLLSFVWSSPTRGDEKQTHFLRPGKVIFEADFDDGVNPDKSAWQLRKSTWTTKKGILRGVNNGGNGPFIRLKSKENGGPLPEDYIIKFSFMIETLPALDDQARKRVHPKLSLGHRFSFGHYAAKYQWRGDKGMDLAIGHGHAIQDERFRIEKGKWYHVTAEIRGDEILVSFKDGPSYYMQHDHFRSKPAGFEFFTHITEAGYLDNIRVWSLGQGTQSGWEELKAKIADSKRSFLSSEHPDFVITKTR